MRFQGVPFERLLQMIASGALGPSAFQRGKRTAAVGLFFHLLIAFIAAFVYYTIRSRMTFLVDHPLPGGVLYGTAIHLVMSRIVVPLSAVPKRKFSARAFLTQLIIHIVCVGLPIALVVAHFAL
jgi:hypothetical protein